MRAAEKLGLRTIVNGSGRMTYLGSSILSANVREAIDYAASRYFDMTELMDKACTSLATLAGAEGSFITCGAGGGIAVCTAALITQGKALEVERVPCVSTAKKEIVLQKGHSVHFGASIAQMIRLGGGVVCEIGQVNKCEAAAFAESITENTAAVLYVKSHHAVQDGQLPLETVLDIAHQKGVPVLVDAAAEEDFEKYVRMGADLVVYSGAKALNGPTAGCIVGKKPYTDWCSAQSKGIARALKVGKETIVGLLEAVHAYMENPAAVPDPDFWVPLETYLSKIPGFSVERVGDSVGRSIVRLRIGVDETRVCLTAVELCERLKTGSPAVYTRAHHAETGYFEFDPRPLSKEDIPTIIEKFKTILGE